MNITSKDMRRRATKGSIGSAGMTRVKSKRRGESISFGGVRKGRDEKEGGEEGLCKEVGRWQKEI